MIYLINIYIERVWRTIKYQYIYLDPENNGLGLYNLKSARDLDIRELTNG